MVGVITCAGKSSRLFPATKCVSKQILSLYDKPLIYYPISMLLKVGIKDIVIVVNSENEEIFKRLLGDGSDFGANIKIIVDYNPQGTVGSFLVAKEYLKGQKVCFVLGDNFFYGDSFDEQFLSAVNLESGAFCFGYPVKNPSMFGVANVDKNGNITKLVEKPVHPESKWAITGLYVYDETCVEKAEKVQFSSRGELEVTDLNNMYLSEGKLFLKKMSKKVFWLDAGTSEGMFNASNYVRKIQKKKKMVACLEEIAYESKLITKEKLLEDAEKIKKSDYGKYLLNKYKKNLI